MDAVRYDPNQRRASRKQQLLNCAAWNWEQAKRAEQLKDVKRTARLFANADRLREQAEQL